MGCFVFAPVGQWLLEIYDWKNAMLIVAGVTLNGCVFGALLRNLEPAYQVKKPREKNVFDRLKEDIEKKTRTRKTSDIVPARREIIQVTTCFFCLQDKCIVVILANLMSSIAPL